MFAASSGVLVGAQRHSAVWGRATVAIARGQPTISVALPVFRWAGSAVATAFAGRSRSVATASAGRSRTVATASAGRARPSAGWAWLMPPVLFLLFCFGLQLGFAPRPELLDLHVQPLQRAPASLWGGSHCGACLGARVVVASYRNQLKCSFRPLGLRRTRGRATLLPSARPRDRHRRSGAPRWAARGHDVLGGHGDHVPLDGLGHHVRRVVHGRHRVRGAVPLASSLSFGPRVVPAS